MKKVNKKLSLNKNVITSLNGVKGGAEALPTGIVCGATIGASVGGGLCVTNYESCKCPPPSVNCVSVTCPFPTGIIC